MEIIKHGKPTKLQIYFPKDIQPPIRLVFTCTKCECQYACDSDETVVGTGTPHSGKYINAQTNCPNCGRGNTVFIDRDSLEVNELDDSTYQPLSPDETRQHKNKRIPDFVIKAVNEMLIKKMGTSNYITLKQDDIANEAKKLGKLKNTQVLYDNNWMDFEEIFREAGWEVTYDKPGYNEDYEPTFQFKKKK